MYSSGAFCPGLHDQLRPAPYVVEDGDYGGRRELYLKHYHDGRDLDGTYAERTLEQVYQLWDRPVHLESWAGAKTVIFTCSGDGVQKIEV